MPLTYTPLVLKGLNLQDPNQLRAFQQQICDFLNAIGTASGISGVLNGTQLLSQALSLVQVASTPTTNQTVDTTKSSLVWINYSWATAANFTATLNNVVDGQIVMFSLFNGSGAARTITLLANTPASSAITVATGTSVVSSGVSVANGVTVVLMGMASATNLVLRGAGQNW